jgi:hypothetical protein
MPPVATIPTVARLAKAHKVTYRKGGFYVGKPVPQVVGYGSRVVLKGSNIKTSTMPIYRG